MIKLLLLALAFLALPVSARERKCVDEGWRFILADSPEMSANSYDDSAWRLLDLPHDWAIEGDFSASNPSGAGGGALPGGIGWYRKQLQLKPKAGERYFIDFDGVYMNSTVYVNGHELGKRPYGYSSFRYELTPWLRPDGNNIIAVKVDNSDQPNSRWYSGCGIYRHVWVESAAAVSVGHWGTYIVPVLKGNGTAQFKVVASIENTTGKTVKAIVRNTLLDAEGRRVASSQSAMKLAAKGDNTQTLSLRKPRLWSVEHPYIYTMRTEVVVDGSVVDTYDTTTGVRTFKFDSKKGFSLNGKSMKINGVCQHHDLGCLGAALSEDALHRQLTMLRDMGCNAVRCSHNPPSPELLNMCDTMGIIVMDESFDMWRKKKTQNDYARFFDEWHERDLTDLIVRDRNHPSILMWSIGNEVLEQWNQADADTLTLEQANRILNFGHDMTEQAKESGMNINSLLTKRLADIVRSLDPTRPITAGCNEPEPSNNLFRSKALDIIGFNYHRQWIKDVPKNFPDMPFLMTESVSALQTRGHYTMPSDSLIAAPLSWDKEYTDPSFRCSAYDNVHVPWGSNHESTWDIVKHTPYCCGQFIWTGWDYIGEPTPYGFPARSSYFGIIDLAGFPKDSYYMYQSEWTDKPVLHLFPHWNWLEGQDIDMWCYYNDYDDVELFVNGKSQGVQRKKDSHQFHVAWRVKYEPGEVKVVAHRGGKAVAEQTIRTAGAPDHIRLTADRSAMTADGKSLAFVTVEVLDKDGNLCPHADDQIFFDVSGNGAIAGVDNGLQTSMERFKDNKRKAFNGKCLVVLRAGKTPGKLHIKAKSYNLKSSELTFDIAAVR